MGQRCNLFGIDKILKSNNVPGFQNTSLIWDIDKANTQSIQCFCQSGEMAKWTKAVDLQGNYRQLPIMKFSIDTYSHIKQQFYWYVDWQLRFATGISMTAYDMEVWTEGKT